MTEPRVAARAPRSATRLVAHRGVHDEAAGGPRENTPAAIRAALARGVRMIEIDVRVSRDGAVVLLHDATLERLWGDPRPVGEVDLTDLRELGGGERRIPLLAEALELVRDSGAILLIDMDEPAPAGPAAEVVRAAGATAFSAWCGHPEAMRTIRAALPGAEIWQPWYATEPPTAADLAELRPAVVNAEQLLVGRAWVEAVHALGAAVSCWTVDDPAQAAHLATIGVDSITTNRVTEVRDAIAAGAIDERGRQIMIATELAQHAAEVTRHARANGVGAVDTKTGPADHVTEIDRTIERRVRAVIGAQFPDHDLVGEEFGGTSDGARPCWYVDPIDGTANLANGVPWTSFSLALVEADHPVVGAVIDPVLLTPVVAAKGRGAWRDGLRLRTTPWPGPSPLAGAVVTTELAGARPWNGLTTLMERLAELHCTLRIPGSGTATLSGLATGRGAGAIIHRYSPIDHAAAILIILEAGGTVLAPTGEPGLPALGDPVIAASDPTTAAALWTEWNTALTPISRR
ncbi:inositol monophosphatase family protein [Microlunatus speluncae]|uniref:inositol monophosphatase family protein n=1 Tax=Microlunatus speluncae TaxID=2594267 RepID=UPI00126674A8|nr:inositol monophosphatase family protein [Microlunatus speluncae]